MQISRKYQVSNLAGSSRDGQRVYINSLLPECMTLKDGRVVYTDKYLAMHEMSEKIFMDVFGYKYDYAHELATKMEREAVEADGVPWKEYQEYMLKMVKKLHTITGEEPPDLDLEPEIDTHENKELAVYAHWCQHAH